MDIRPYVLIAERRARSDGRTGIAVDLGFGSGAVPIFLLQRGWHVTAVDVDAVAVDDLHARVPKDLRPLLTVLCADFRALQLPACKFINAGYVLQYVSPREFRKFWKNMTHLLEKKGVFVGNFLVRMIYLLTIINIVLSFHKRSKNSSVAGMFFLGRIQWYGSTEP